MPRFLLLLASLFLFFVASAAHAQESPPRPTGFTAERAMAQQQCEARLAELPSSEAFRTHLETLTRRPHPTGSDANRAVADYMARVMDEAGLEVQRYPYDVYLPQLTTDSEVALVTPVRLPLNDQEYILEEDRFSDDPALGPGWNAFSGEGDVTGEVVYANYGRKEDYERLEELGVAVEGKIVVARYGGNFRGYKVAYAEDYGAAGVIMYTDPADGGYTAGPAYPEGRYLSESTVQRGSVLTLPYTGDPLTPFEPALPTDGEATVERLDPAAVEDLHGIPVTPLPYASAREILERMTGEPVPSGWQGGLPFTYRLTGGSGLTVRLRVEQPKALTRVENVVGTIEGTEAADQWVVLGAHYDAWGFGAVDPNGGTAMLLTLAQALGQMAADGCRPRRTIKIAHWDAEEYGIIGSAEWAEQLREPLDAGAVAYLNADAAVSGGWIGAAAAPSLKGPIEEAARAVSYPGSDTLSVYDQWQQQGAVRLSTLGGGSDHVAFYTHLAIPSAGVSFGSHAPIYHSNYDNFAWYERFGDTSFVYGPALAQMDGVLALRLANADVLPYDVARYATDLHEHLDAVETRAAQQDVAVDLNALRMAVDTLAAAAEAFEAARGVALTRGLDAEAGRAVNDALVALERTWLHPEGLQGRPWSRSLYAGPDPFSGYAAWALPGLRYAVETGADDVGDWTARYEAVVRTLAQRLRTLAQRLR